MTYETRKRDYWYNFVESAIFIFHLPVFRYKPVEIITIQFLLSNASITNKCTNNIISTHYIVVQNVFKFYANTKASLEARKAQNS